MLQLSALLSWSCNSSVISSTEAQNLPVKLTVFPEEKQAPAHMYKLHISLDIIYMNSTQSTN